jgi:hypothetical protein
MRFFYLDCSPLSDEYEGDQVIMNNRENSLEEVQKVFMDKFRGFNLKLPEENLRDRKPGSIPYGSGRILFVFGKERGMEYLEYYAHHRMGDSHGKIYENGERISLPELSSMFSYDPKIPGDEEKKKAEMEKSYRETFEDLERKGLLSAGPIPGSFLINAQLVMKKEEK